jgi:Tfp pilus assembly protein PilO
MNALTTLALLGISIASFFVYTNPTYKSVESLKAEAAQYELALDKAKEAEVKKEELISKYNTFSADDLDNLYKLLPDTVDNIRLLLDINQVASSYGTSITNIQVDSGQTNTQANDPRPYGSLIVKFTITLSYENFQKFLRDIERNLRVTDINTLSFISSESGLYTYEVAIKTYWLK